MTADSSMTAAITTSPTITTATGAAPAMHYVGLDVHARRSSVCVLNADGKTVKRFEVRGDWPALLERVARDVPRPFAVAFEASCGYGYLHNRLSRMAERVTVAHPGRMRLIYKSKHKHDRVDADKTAKLLYLDAIPQVHVPPADVRAWRGPVEYRRRLVGRRVAVKNQVRALLRGLGVPGVPAGKALWSNKGLAWLRKLTLDEADGSVGAIGTGADILRRDLLAEELADLTAEIKRVGRELDARADHHPGVTLLRTIPGVGVRTAEAVVAYLDDVRRFARNRQVGCYLGLVPCQDASADRNRLGHVTGDGPATVRKLLCEAAWQAVRRSPATRAYFERVAGGKPDRRKVALVATAHKLARSMQAMLKSGEAWRE